jgi:hypothetical protein
MLDLALKDKDRAADSNDHQVEAQGNANPEVNLEDCLAPPKELRIVNETHAWFFCLF